jgi:hypothetical protein
VTPADFFEILPTACVEPALPALGLLATSLMGFVAVLRLNDPHGPMVAEAPVWRRWLVWPSAAWERRPCGADDGGTEVRIVIGAYLEALVGEASQRHGRLLTARLDEHPGRQERASCSPRARPGDEEEVHRGHHPARSEVHDREPLLA